MRRVYILLALISGFGLLLNGQENSKELIRNEILISELIDSLNTLLNNSNIENIAVLKDELISREKRKVEKNEQTGKVYSTIGYVHYKLHNYDSAEVYANKSLTILNRSRGNNEKYLIPTYLLLGQIAGTKFNFDLLIDYQEKALEISKLVYEGRNKFVGICYNDLGISYTYLNSPEKYHKALNAFKQARYHFLPDKNNLTIELISVHINIGDMYLQLGRYQKAQKELFKAISIQKDNPNINETLILNAYDRLGRLKVSENDFHEAIRYFNICKTIQDQFGHQPNYPSLLNYISQLNLEIGDTLEANNLYNESLKKLNVINYDINNVDPPAMTVLYNVLFSRLDYFRKVYSKRNEVNTKDSILFLTDKILEVQEAIENSTLSKNNRQILNTYAFSAYSDAIENYFDYSEKDLNKIFRVIESTKSKFIFQFGNQFQNETLEGFTQDRAEEKRLKSNINQLEVAIFNQENKKANTNLSTESLKDSLFRQKIALQAVLEKIKKDYPQAFQLNMEESILTLEKIQGKLKANECVLEYFVGEEAIFIFVINTKEIQIKKVDKDFPLDDWINQMREGIYDYWVLPGQPDKVLSDKTKAYSDAAYQLYTHLIAPIENYLKEKILIIPDAMLNLLPFDALIKEIPSDPRDFQNFAFLLKEHTIYYDYAASLHWIELARNKKRNKKKIAIFAPQFEKQNANVISSTRTVRSIREDLGYLQYNDEEANRLLALLQGDKYGDRLASKKSFLENASDYNILHLATHGKASDQLGDYSFIAFSENEKDSTQNNLLYVRELYELDLNADLVVLSACETGIGEFRRGEGIISVAKGFSYAGARSTVTTLWNIYDHPVTVELMEQFYKNLKQGSDKDEALRNAKLATLANPATASPYFWAGFIPIGDMSPIQSGGDNWWLYMLLTGLALVAIWVYFKSKRKSPK